ncbi:MAG: hypothetical protein H3C38_13500 [Rhodospirillales bacterium]|nr:hypothetical protein [Rhodospirillales bacterium]
MRRFVFAALACVILSTPAAAADRKEPSPGELLGEAGEKLMRALETMLKAIPQYAAPEINENGDIIIRRIRPDDRPPRKDQPAQPVPTGRDKATQT